jgi:hypothetical protein
MQMDSCRSWFKISFIRKYNRCISKAGGKGKLQEFANDEEEVALEKYGEIGEVAHRTSRSGWSCFWAN